MATNQKGKMFIAIFLAFLMIFSIAGIIGSSINSNPSSTTEVYNGFTFTQGTQGYTTTVNDQKASFAFLPRQLEYISTIKPKITGEKVYLSIDPTMNVTAIDARQRLSTIARFVGTRPVDACITEVECPPDLPITACPHDAMVLQFTSGPLSIREDGPNCYTLQANDELEFYKLAEFISFTSLGILP